MPSASRNQQLEAEAWAPHALSLARSKQTSAPASTFLRWHEENLLGPRGPKPYEEAGKPKQVGKRAPELPAD